MAVVSTEPSSMILPVWPTDQRSGPNLKVVWHPCCKRTCGSGASTMIIKLIYGNWPVVQTTSVLGWCGSAHSAPQLNVVTPATELPQIHWRSSQIHWRSSQTCHWGPVPQGGSRPCCIKYFNNESRPFDLSLARVISTIREASEPSRRGVSVSGHRWSKG